MRRANGQGSIDQFRGKWRVRVWIDGKRRQYGPLYDTEEQAALKLACWHRTRSGYDTASQITLRAFGAEWLELRTQEGSAHRQRVLSIETERSAWNRHVSTSELADLAVVEITEKHIESFARMLRDKHAVYTITSGPVTARVFDHRDTGVALSASSQRHVLRLLRTCFDHATDEQLITKNPAARARPKPGGRRPRDLSDDWLRMNELEALFTCTTIRESDRIAYHTAIGTALRQSDLRLLEVAQVHLDAEVPGPHVRVWIAKSQKWHSIPLMPWFVPALRRWIASLPVGARFVFSPDADHATPYAKGHSFCWETKRSSRGAAPSALEKAGVRRQVRFHDIRGTTATHLALGSWGRKWSLHEIQGMLAHSDQKVTERYVRRAIDMLATAAQGTPGAVGSRWSEAIELSPTPPPGIEPGTFRLEDAGIEKEVRGDSSSWNQRVTQLAARLPTTTAEIGSELVTAVMELAESHPAVAAYLALADDPSGPRALRRTITLLDALGAVAVARVESEAR